MRPIPCDLCHATATFSHMGSTGRPVFRCPMGHVQVFQDAVPTSKEKFRGL